MDLPSSLKTHWLIGHMVRRCFKLFSTTRLSFMDSSLFPHSGKPAFCLGPSGRGFPLVTRFGASHFLVADAWLTLQAMTDVAGSYHLDFWRAVQLHNFLSLLSSPCNYGRHLTTLEEYCSDQRYIILYTFKDVLLAGHPSQRLPTALSCKMGVRPG